MFKVLNDTTENTSLNSFCYSYINILTLGQIFASLKVTWNMNGIFPEVLVNLEFEQKII